MTSSVPMESVGRGGGGLSLQEQLAMTNLLVHELERMACDQEVRMEALLDELSGRTGVLGATIDGIPDPVAVVDENGAFTHFNAAAERFFEPARASGTLDHWRTAELYRADDMTRFAPDEIPLARALRGEPVEGEEMFAGDPASGEGMWLVVSVKPIRREGVYKGAVIVLRDITERKAREHEIERQLVREKEKNELLERMRDAISQLSTPILEVWDDVLAVPIVGVVDSMRASEMMDRVLAEVERKQCRYLIIDITGVEVVDTMTADRFAKLVTAVEILGAQCFLTGVRAVVARAMASLGVDLGRLSTFRTLKHALAECMRLTAAGQAGPRLEDLLAGREVRRG